jgi:hypothetical protein
MAAGWLVSVWKSRKESSQLVRYEDLVTRLAETMERVLAYLGVDRSPKLAEKLARGAVEHSELDGHRTSRSVEASVGRWHRDLPRRFRSAIRESPHEPLAEFGYEFS